MEKLIELLNERIKEGWKPYGYDYSITKIDEIWKSDGLYFVSFVGEDYPGPVNLEHILMKQAGLIKWLVENDKIKDYYEGNDDIDYVREKYGFYESLLMILAIQDEPIRFLCEIIK